MDQTPIKTIFFGTHQFAATILEGLLAMPFLSVDLVVTQPDRPVGRKREMEKPPVKLIAEKFNISTEQPTSLKIYKLTAKSYQLGVVAQYGLIIPNRIVESPTYGILNVHTSLLPKYRGASPIQTVLMNGGTETGITIMKMDAGIDTGPILLQKKIQIEPDDTCTTLEDKLASLGIEGLLEAIPSYLSGALKPIPQDESQATTTKLLSRDDGKIDWNTSVRDIYNHYRGLTPWPGVWTTWEGKRLKLISIKPSTNILTPGTVEANSPPAGPLRSEASEAGQKIFIGCADGSIEILTLQLEGKKAMDAGAFIHGYARIDGQQLG